MTVERVKFSHAAYENDNKWNYRIMNKDDYQRREQVKLESNSQTQIVYDYMDKSPFYTDANPYIDERKLLESKNNAGFVNPRIKGRGYRRPMINTGIPKKDKVYTNLNPYYIVEGEDDTTLVFESRFESGNLKRAIKVNEFEYDLVLRNDYNSQGYTQWYYFKVTNTRADRKYLFNLYHFYKQDSIYNEGMRPLIYSRKKEAKEGVGWMRIGEDICYYQNTTKRKSGPGYLYSLSFSFDLPFDDDEVYFCHHYPYTYRDCKEFLEDLCTEEKKEEIVSKKDRIRKTEMCKSLAGNSLDLVIITNFLSSEQDISQRDAVIITGRVHPGESNSSYIVQGILEFLVSDEPEAIQLRDKYVFKIIPMLNPDGVILGNYR